MSPRAASRLESLGFTQVYDYTGGKQDWGASGLPLEGKLGADRIGRLVREVSTCFLGESLTNVRERALHSGGCVVINADRVVLGWLSAETLSSVSESSAGQAMELGPSTFRPNVPLREMRDYMNSRNIGHALVTSSDGRLVGTVDLSDIEHEIHKSEQRTRQKRYI